MLSSAPFTQKGWVQPLLLLTFVYLMLFSNLGGYDLSAPDEPRFALVAREMLTNNHWLLPHRNDHAYPDKPPLFFWSIAAVSVLNGGHVTATTARLPSALAAMWVLWLMWGFARGKDKDKDNTLALLTVLILVSATRFFFQARMAQIDMLLCGLTTAAGCLGFRLVSDNIDPAERKATQRNLGILMGLAILAKGPVGYLVPAGAMAMFCAFCGKLSWRNYPRKALLWGLLPPLIWIVLLLVEVAIADQWDYLNNMLFKQTVVRYLNPWHHYQPFYYFLKVPFYDFLPWVFLLLTAIPFTKKDRSQLDAASKFAWAFVLFTIVFFSLSKGKRNLYILPMYPMAAFLVATKVKALLANIKNKPIWSIITPSGLLMLVFGAFIALAAGSFRDRIPKEMVNLPVAAFGLVGALGALVGVLGLGSAWRGRTRGAFASLLIMIGLINILFFQVIMPWISPYRSARQFSESASKIIAADASRPVVAMVLYRSAYRLYGNYPLVELSSENNNPPGLPKLNSYWSEHPQGWVIIRRKHLEEFKKNHPGSTTIHLEVTVGRGEKMLLVTQ